MRIAAIDIGTNSIHMIVIAPEAAPTPVTWPSLNFSTVIQARVDAQVATNVVTMTMAAAMRLMASIGSSEGE